MVSNISYGRFNVSDRINFIPHSQTLNRWVVKPDSFEYTNGVSSFEEKEITRLFPNGELDKIYSGIAKDYGLETTPKLDLKKDFNLGDRGYYSGIDNSIKLVLDFLKPEARKILIHNGDQSFYTVGDSRGLLFRVKDEDIKKELTEIEGLGFKAEAKPLTDDDKRKLTVFLLAHELSHALQNQYIRHTEGLNEWEMIEARLNNNKPKDMNLIQYKLGIIRSKQNYDKTHSIMNFDKIYSADSPEGKQAKIWYDSNVGYERPENGYESNISNPLETDANERAYKYLKEHFGYFEDAIDF